MATINRFIKDVGLTELPRSEGGFEKRLVWIIPDRVSEKLVRIFGLNEKPEFLTIRGGITTQNNKRVQNHGGVFYTLMKITAEGVVEIIKTPDGKKSFYSGERKFFDVPGGVYVKKRDLEKKRKRHEKQNGNS